MNVGIRFDRNRFVVSGLAIDELKSQNVCFARYFNLTSQFWVHIDSTTNMTDIVFFFNFN